MWYENAMVGSAGCVLFCKLSAGPPLKAISIPSTGCKQHGGKGDVFPFVGEMLKSLSLRYQARSKAATNSLSLH